MLQYISNVFKEHHSHARSVYWRLITSKTRRIYSWMAIRDEDSLCVKLYESSSASFFDGNNGTR